MGTGIIRRSPIQAGFSHDTGAESARRHAGQRRPAPPGRRYRTPPRAGAALLFDPRRKQSPFHPRPRPSAPEATP